MPLSPASSHDQEAVLPHSSAGTGGADPALPEDGEKKLDPENSPADSDSTKVDDAEFKEGGYGWVVVMSVLLVNAHTWGLNASYAVFLAYYLRSGTIGGASALGFAFVGGLYGRLIRSPALLVSPLATMCIGRFGTNPTLRIGTVLQTASFIAASFSTHIWHLILSQGVLFGVAMGFCFTATVGVVPQWFTKRRSFANAISTSGSGFGGLIYSLATNAMITNIGLAWAFRILAILSFVVNGACSLTIRDRNKAVGAIHVAFHLPLFKQVEFWLFTGWGFFGILSYVIVVFSITDYAQKVGFTASQGSVVAAIFSLSQGIGRPLIGLISDRFGRINVAGLGTLLACLAASFLWIFAGKHYAGLIVYSLFGMFAGVIWPCVAPVGAEVVGLQLLPAALSLYWLLLVLPATFAEAIGLELRAPGVDGYIDVQIFTAILFLASFLSIWLLRSWKIRQLDVLGLTEEQQQASIEDADVISTIASNRSGRQRGSVKRPGLFRAYITGMFVVRRV
ncbi:major facilitator superfamily domain-containing protein [Apodospora peruviana]|uniref:Major facilitator superfamily domain-containing protein n=1 Tax=Apodospora peruviana TaxID=516989 RepID=A0AAE0ISN6_9PEZI|nr:major facilitator superfamily domain-containing protein [Apodospora peruviana]